jgi:hypothetical protein
MIRSIFKATLPSSTVEHNKELDRQIVDREQPDRDAPWWQRKFFATTWSAIKSWCQ